MSSRRDFLKQVASTALISCVVSAPIMTTGCNGISIAQDIVNWTPTVESTAATVASTASVLLPQYTAIIQASLVGFTAAAELVKTQAQAYLDNPNQTMLQRLQTAVVTFQGQINSALLNAAKISDSKSQMVITQALNAVATAINAIIALLMRVKGNTVAQAQTAVQHASILDNPLYRPNVKMIQDHYHISQMQAFSLIQDQEFQLRRL